MKKILNPDFLEGFVRKSLLKYPVIWLAKPAYLAYYLMLMIGVFTILGLILPIWFSAEFILMSCLFLTISFCVYVLFLQGKMEINKIPPRQQFRVFLINLFFFSLILTSSFLAYMIIKYRVTKQIGSIEMLERDKINSDLLASQNHKDFDKFRLDYKKKYLDNGLIYLDNFDPNYTTITSNNPSGDSIVFLEERKVNRNRKIRFKKKDAYSVKNFNKAVKDYFSFKKEINTSPDILEISNLINKIKNVQYIKDVEDKINMANLSTKNFTRNEKQNSITNKLIYIKVEFILDSLAKNKVLTNRKIQKLKIDIDDFQNKYQNNDAERFSIDSIGNFNFSSYESFKSFILTNLAPNDQYRYYVEKLLQKLNINLFELNDKFKDSNVEFEKQFLSYLEDSYSFGRFKSRNSEISKIYFSLFANYDMAEIKRNLFNRYEIKSQKDDKVKFSNLDKIAVQSTDLKTLASKIRNSEGYMKSDLESILFYFLTCFGSALACLTIYQVIIATSITNLLIGFFISFCFGLMYTFLYTLPEFFGISGFYRELFGGNTRSEEHAILGIPFLILSIVLFFSFTRYLKNKIVRKPKMSQAFSAAFLMLSFIILPLGFLVIGDLFCSDYSIGVRMDTFQVSCSIFLAVLAFLLIFYQTIKKFYFIHNYPRES